ncbi:unnamed protein product [Diamesa hyperborea]
MKTFAICTLALLAVSLKLSRAEHHQHPEHHKKDPMGFFGSRGKRSITEAPSTVDYTNSDETNLREWSDMKSPIDGAMLQREIRAPKGFFGMRGKKGNYETWEQDKRALIGMQNLRDRSRLLSDPEFSAFAPKRAPAQGFFGMRGKKYGDYDQINGLSNGNSYGNGFENNNKRAPSGFMGMRGKKSNLKNFDVVQRHIQQLLGISFGDMDNQFKGFQEKRVPSGFMGMRGKKYYGFKRAPSGFMGMRGKKSYEEVDGNSIYDEDLESELYQELLNERLLMSHYTDDNQLNELEKRAPSGFMGMRGKKSVSNTDYFESDKRAPMGFQGVRGKKSQFENFLVTENKRGPVTGFFGTRGKKQPNTSSYFGVRKKPYEFRGKFVGVRGKKAPDGSLKTLTLDFNGIQQAGELRPAQLVNSETNPHNKRLGFIGMRESTTNLTVL